MNQTNLKQFTDLLDQNKFTEAKQLIKQQSPAATAWAYTKAINQVNRHYLHTINQTISRLNELRKVKQDLNKHLVSIDAVTDK